MKIKKIIYNKMKIKKIIYSKMKIKKIKYFLIKKIKKIKAMNNKL